MLPVIFSYKFNVKCYHATNHGDIIISYGVAFSQSFLWHTHLPIWYTIPYHMMYAYHMVYWPYHMAPYGILTYVPYRIFESHMCCASIPANGRKGNLCRYPMVAYFAYRVIPYYIPYTLIYIPGTRYYIWHMVYYRYHMTYFPYDMCSASIPANGREGNLCRYPIAAYFPYHMAYFTISTAPLPTLWHSYHIPYVLRV